MSEPRQPRYTNEVQQALIEQAIANRDQQPLAPSVPEGHVQYFVVVGESETSGVGTPDAVAAILRATADQLQTKQGVTE
jgi:hypothetical protein